MNGTIIMNLIIKQKVQLITKNLSESSQSNGRKKHSNMECTYYGPISIL